MHRRYDERLAALERRTRGHQTIPIVIVDEDGRIIGELSARPLRPFDYATAAAELLAAMGHDDEAVCG